MKHEPERTAKTKREFYFGLTGGIKNLEAHFSDMAEKGWMIEKIGTVFIRYRAAEPCAIRFHVDVLPEIGVFDYPHGRAAVNYRKRCEENGWRFVTAQRAVNVFCADAATSLTAQPINTDNREQCKAYMKVFRKNELLSGIFMAAALVYFMYFVIIRGGAEIFYSDFSMLASLGLLLGLPAVILYFAANAAWYVRTWLAYRQDLPLPVIRPGLCRAIKVISITELFILFTFVTAGIVLTWRSGVPILLIVFIISVPLIGLAIGLLARRRI